MWLSPSHKPPVYVAMTGKGREWLEAGPCHHPRVKKRQVLAGRYKGGMKPPCWTPSPAPCWPASPTHCLLLSPAWKHECFF